MIITTQWYRYHIDTLASVMTGFFFLFQEIIQILCLEMSDHEAEMIAKKFENKKDSR